jgi:SAM-dependent methyltransferase
MKWKYKSLLQNVISLLPDKISYPVYYYIQRNFGRLKNTNPLKKLASGVEAWNFIIKSGFNPTEKVFLEIGTGYVPIIPISYWLMGAKKVITIDINPYLKDELLFESIDFICNNQKQVISLFGDFLVTERFNKLVEANHRSEFDPDHFLSMMNIQYISPCDASKTNFPSQTIDICTSYNVLEHIPPSVIQSIVIEGRRILTKDGLMVHKIDYSDHFSHTDKNISPLNFLKYSDYKWNKFAGNRYMYMNRLRHDDMKDIFLTNGYTLIDEKCNLDQLLLTQIKSRDFFIDNKFSDKSDECLANTDSWVSFSVKLPDSSLC